MLTYACCQHCATDTCPGRLCVEDRTGCPHGSGLCDECRYEACDDCLAGVA